MGALPLIAGTAPLRASLFACSRCAMAQKAHRKPTRRNDGGGILYTVPPGLVRVFSLLSGELSSFLASPDASLPSLLTSVVVSFFFLSSIGAAASFLGGVAAAARAAATGSSGSALGGLGLGRIPSATV